jgi:hypothetical protein
MLSAIAMDESLAPQPEPLYDDYMIKPIDLRQLLEKFHALLDIEWTTRDEALEPTPGSPAPTRPGESLPPEAMEALIELGQIGHFRGISAMLDDIETRSPDHAASVAELRAIVDTFDLRRLLAVLQAQRRAHAP